MSARSLQLNPLNAQATAAQIKAKRDELEQSPITTTFGVFDANEKSVARLEAALLYFSQMPLTNGEIVWTKADNTTVSLDETEFGDLVAEISSAWALRSAIVHAKAQLLVTQPITLGELDNLALWGL